MSDYPRFPKIPRLHDETFTITEKIDGTNGLIYIVDGRSSLVVPYRDRETGGAPPHVCLDDDFCVYAGSRKKWITPNQDNHGFAEWVWGNASALATGLGPGHHYGEWAGPGINGNRHGLSEKTFFLFNLRKYEDLVEQGWGEFLPDNVKPVPVLQHSVPVSEVFEEARRMADALATRGTMATVGPRSDVKGVVARGQAEGIVLRSDLTGQRLKYFCGGEEANRTSKGEAA